MKNDWYYTIIIVILSIAVVAFWLIALKKPKCAFEFKDIDGANICAVRK